jgi:methyl-accepting chemotaxis protein
VVFAEDAAAGLAKLGASLEEFRTEMAQLAARLDATDREVDGVQRVATDGLAAVTELGQRLDAARDGIARLAEAVVALGEDQRDLRRRIQ